MWCSWPQAELWNRIKVWPCGIRIALDQIGPITKSSEDAALLLSAIAGKDPLDSTSIDNVESNPLSKLNGDIKGLKIGIPKEYFSNQLDSKILNHINEAIKKLESLGAEIVDISLPHTEYAVSTYYIIATAEASANLARFDAVRYGHRADSVSYTHLTLPTKA